MREMKDSGVEWIGIIPKNWILKKGKYIFSQRNEKGNRINLQLLSPTQKFGVIPQVMYEELTTNSAVKLKEGTDLTQLKTIHKNDYCISLRSFQGGFEYSKYEGVVSPAYQVFFASIEVCPGYFKYLFKMQSFIDKMNSYTMSLRDGKNIAFDDFGNTLIPVPTLSEQQKISAYLDHKCSEIDALYSDISGQISTLEEYKKSVITEAVTKGLKPNAEMKDSGIEWIGMIPKGWEINRTKYLFTSGKGLSITKENLIEEGLPVISYGQIHSKSNTGVGINDELLRYVSFDYKKTNPSCEVKKYDFIFADTSEDYEGCGNCVYKRDNNLLFAGYHSVVLHSTIQKDNRYFAYLFLTNLWRKQLRETAFGVKVFSITQKKLMNTLIIVPTENEQLEIANYLDKQCSEVDALIEEKKEQLATLEKYKKSLIYEYVTGKKEVPDNDT